MALDEYGDFFFKIKCGEILIYVFKKLYIL